MKAGGREETSQSTPLSVSCGQHRWQCAPFIAPAPVVLAATGSLHHAPDPARCPGFRAVVTLPSLADFGLPSLPANMWLLSNSITSITSSLASVPSVYKT